MPWTPKKKTKIISRFRLLLFAFGLFRIARKFLSWKKNVYYMVWLAFYVELFYRMKWSEHEWKTSTRSHRNTNIQTFFIYHFLINLTHSQATLYAHIFTMHIASYKFDKFNVKQTKPSCVSCICFVNGWNVAAVCYVYFHGNFHE